MEALLKKITPDYRSFVDDQVLTAGQLNEFINYFEDQDRLTRVCLNGVGIACGFQVTFHATHKQISITQGCGVTTDGDLIKLLSAIPDETSDKSIEQKTILYTHYREFQDEYAQYQHFHTLQEDDSLKQIPLWELKAENTQDEDFDLPLTGLDLSDKIVLLYLESYPKTPDICTETNCDNQGDRQVRRLRVLLVSESDMGVITEQDSLFTQHDILGVYNVLPEIKMPRIILKAGAREIANPPQIDISDLLDLGIFRPDLNINLDVLNSLYKDKRVKEKITPTPLLTNNTEINPRLVNLELANTITAVNLPKINLDALTLINFSPTINTKTYNALAQSYRSAAITTINQLIQGFNAIQNAFNELLKNDPAVHTKMIACLQQLKKTTTDLNIQYLYDHVKDLTDTYAEIKELLVLVQVACCPPVDAFPKHLMLGKLGQSERFLRYRHEYYYSHVSGSRDENLMRVRLLLKRAATMCSSFTLQMVNTIGITPSNWHPFAGDSGLGNKSKTTAIPFFYKISEDLLYAWDYDKTKIFREHYNLSYHKELLKNVSSVQNPLQYDLDEFDFLRIEGIQGKDYKNAIKQLDQLKKDNGLAFDIKALSINQQIEDIDMKDYACHFDYLETSLKAWTAEQNCLNAEVTEFFSGFSARNPGKHNYTFEIFDFGLLYNLRETKEKSTTKEKEKIITNLTDAGRTGNTLDKKENTLYKTTAIKGKNYGNSSSVVMNSGIQYLAPIKYEIPVNKVVKETLNTKEDDLGFIFDAVVTDNYIGNYRDIYADIFDQYVTIFPDLVYIDPDIRKVSVEIPTTILALLQVASSYIPATLNQASKTGKENFAAAMDELCEYITTARGEVNDIFYGPNSTYTKVGYETKYVLLLNRIQENCCAAERLEVILTEIENKKTEILDELIFENFVRKHPGLEHKAGVPMGGTFVMVYAGALREESDDNIPENTVVADFCLPYMCCSDCAPVGFIVPDATSSNSLILEKDTLCLDEDGQENIEIAFTASPIDALVAPSKEIKGLQIQNKNISIDPVNFNAFDVPIQFTVNGQLTNAQITVHKKPKFSIATSPDQLIASPGSTITFKVHVVNENNFNPSLFKYAWKIEDKEYTVNTPIHTKRIESTSDQKTIDLPVSVRLYSDDCGTELPEETITISLETQTETTISLDPTTYCESDDTNYPIEITPPSQNVKITGPGVQQLNGVYVFTPIRVPSPGEHTLSVEGGNTLTITVNEQPKGLRLTQQLDEAKNQLIVSSSYTSNEATYSWSLDGKPLSEKGSQIEFDLQDPINGILTLRVENSPCSFEETKITINTTSSDPTDDTNNTCIEESLERLKKTKDLLQKDMTAPGFNKIINDRTSQALFKNVFTYYGQLEQNPAIFKGADNNELQKQITAFLESAHDLILNSEGTKREILTQLYLQIQEVFYTALRCQGSLSLNTDVLNNLLELIESHYDPKAQDSLTAIQAFEKIEAQLRKQLEATHGEFKGTHLQGHLEFLIRSIR